jgi:hypothetical protein
VARQAEDWVGDPIEEPFEIVASMCEARSKRCTDPVRIAKIFSRKLFVTEFPLATKLKTSKTHEMVTYMLTISSTKDELKENLNLFLWTFKIGDNILYNLDVIFKLIEDHNKSSSQSYTKPISILCVSVIEAILVDFLERLDSATRQFPDKLSKNRMLIKSELSTRKRVLQRIYKGQVYQYKRLENFGYKDLIEVYEKFKILGASVTTYAELQDLGRFRNRVHIRNYFENFERDESRTFSETRTQRAINSMEKTIAYLGRNYPRL